MKSVAIVCVAVTMAMMASGFIIKPSPRSPVGTCPSKNGEYPVYLADATDCQIFYECNSGTPVKKECLQGLCFDPQLNVCAFPASKTRVLVRGVPVGKCPNRTSGTPTFLPDSEDCNIYYECRPMDTIGNLAPEEMNCPPDLCFNPSINACDFPINVDNSTSY